MGWRVAMSLAKRPLEASDPQNDMQALHFIMLSLFFKINLWSKWQISFLKTKKQGMETEWRTLTRRKTGSNPPYPSSSNPPYLSPTCSTTRCHKNYLERLQSVETRNKKQEEKRKKKIEQENWKGSLLMISSTLSYIII